MMLLAAFQSQPRFSDKGERLGTMKGPRSLRRRLDFRKYTKCPQTSEYMEELVETSMNPSQRLEHMEIRSGMHVSSWALLHAPSSRSYPSYGSVASHLMCAYGRFEAA